MGQGDYTLSEFAARLSTIEDKYAKELQSAIECFSQSRLDLPVKKLEDISKARARCHRQLKKAVDAKKTDGVNMWKVCNIYSACAVDTDNGMREVRNQLRKKIKKDNIAVKARTENDYKPSGKVKGGRAKSQEPTREPQEIYDQNKPSLKEKLRWLDLWKQSVDGEGKKKEEAVKEVRDLSARTLPREEKTRPTILPAKTPPKPTLTRVQSTPKSSRIPVEVSLPSTLSTVMSSTTGVNEYRPVFQPLPPSAVAARRPAPAPKAPPRVQRAQSAARPPLNREREGSKVTRIEIKPAAALPKPVPVQSAPPVPTLAIEPCSPYAPAAFDDYVDVPFPRVSPRCSLSLRPTRRPPRPPPPKSQAPVGRPKASVQKRISMKMMSPIQSAASAPGSNSSTQDARVRRESSLRTPEPERRFIQKRHSFKCFEPQQPSPIANKPIQRFTADSSPARTVHRAEITTTMPDDFVIKM